MSNKCNCPNPPGGIVTCSDNQLAVCSYQNGEIVSGCFDRPEHLSSISNRLQSNFALANWALSQIMGVTRSDTDSIEPHMVQLLRSGEYTDEKAGIVTRFALPSDLSLEGLSAAQARSA